MIKMSTQTAARTSAQIENELHQTTRRLDELTEMRDGINNNLKTLQDGFIDGKTPLEKLQAEQGKLTTLDSSIKTLEAKQGEVRTAFQKAILSESRKILLEKAKESAMEAEAAFNAHIESRHELNKLIGDRAAKMLDERILFLTKQREYRLVFQQIEKQSPEKSGQIHDELSQIGLTDEAANLATAAYENYPNYPLAEFGEVIAIAIRLVVNKRERAAKEAQRLAA